MKALPIIFLSAVLFSSHALIVSKNWYSEFWWLDILLHSLGGALIAYVYYVLSGSQCWPCLMAFALFTGLTWEALEFFIETPFFGDSKVFISDPVWLLDTLIDIIISFLFACATWYTFVLQNSRRLRNG